MLVCLSKSLSGLGLPFAITLLRPELDVWSPGEHNGTFRGHNPAFVSAKAALEWYWANDSLERGVADRAVIVEAALQLLADQYPDAIAEVRGRGLVWGVEFRDHTVAGEVSRVAFEHERLIVETCGSRDHVIKLLPPLTISPDELGEGLDRLSLSVKRVLGGLEPVKAVAPGLASRIRAARPGVAAA